LNLPVSVWSSYYVDLSPEQMVDEFAAAGYTVTEFSDEHGAALLERAAGIPGGAEKIGAELKKYADERGVSFPQGHLYLKVDLCADDSAEVLKQWLDLFLALGIRASVLHTSCKQENFSAEERFACWVNRLETLTGYLRGTDMSIALENAGGFNLSAESLLALIDAVGDEHLGICLDTGHLNLAQKNLSGKYPAVECSQSEFIRRAGKRLIALHIADNDGTYDQHMVPFGRGNVDFRDVMRGLEEVGYDRLFNLEIPGERRGPLALRRAKLDFIRKMCDILQDPAYFRGV